MEASVMYETITSINPRVPNYVCMKWKDLPGIQIEFPYYDILTKPVYKERVKSLIFMAMSKMTSVYIQKETQFVLTDLSRKHIPRMIWSPEDGIRMEHWDTYDFMMDLLRMTLIPRILRTPKP
jgi:hypothetical protein